MNKKIKVLVVEDQALFRKGVVGLLESFDSINPIDSVKDGKDAIEFLENKIPDIVLLDLSMPELDGIKTIEFITKNYPMVKCIILSSHDDNDIVVHLFEKGAYGFLNKNVEPENLLEAIVKVFNGGYYLCGESLDNLLSNIRESKLSMSEGIQKLTHREKEILRLISEGLSTPQISKKLNIANSTVESHKRNLIDKTGVQNSKELIIYAQEHKLVTQ